jgi:predicted metal-dependent TIM-barrel fold hydrolase
MNSRSWVIVLAILLIGSNAYWLYNTVDFGITHSYLEASYEHEQKRAAQAIYLANLNLVGMHADAAKSRIGKDVSGLDSFEKEGCLYVGGICLRLDDNRLVVSVETPET